MDQLTSRALARADSAILPAGDIFDGLPLNHYQCIYIDPPWAYAVRSEKGLGRSAERHYPTMKMQDILDLPVADVAAKDAFCFLWITGPFLAQGSHVPVLRAWGFKPSSLAFVWVKTNDANTIKRAQTWDDVLFAGMGFTTRQNVEVVVLGRRGNPKRLDNSIRQIIMAPRREHSRKPDEVRCRIERFCAAPRLEVFARSRHENWTCVGNQVGRFDEI